MKTLTILLVALFTLPAHAVVRSQIAKVDFAKTHTCPSTHKNRLPCPGYIIDHVVSLDCGGKDAPSNMQWQTTAAAKAKDKWERNGPSCQHRTHAPMPKTKP